MSLFFKTTIEVDGFDNCYEKKVYKMSPFLNLTHVSQTQIYCKVVLKRRTYLICLKKST